ncbi:Dam family site-specific DNA-(adenine-N6)-methyltransferase [Helicobacter sp.]|uniref:DNA adenine methylase n=1 Tax=Helicobacter sp. TaxID=218 RepID=UPI00198FBF38|nr:Dam family site-specific DNA-(adenine-N6)-methyltransferase [Helicobacter sp.]MBD5165236.1 Dam family site-specific DNA-(adenine-N6)-methyltransferase [Helicobacter sp.]
MTSRTIQENSIRSPFFYVGDKYKLMPQLKRLFPNKIKTYIEPFVGGGSSFLNIKAKQYLLNDINPYLINLHLFLQTQSQQKILDSLFQVIEDYNLSCSIKNIIPPLDLRATFKKTYFAKYNKESYLRLRNDFNQNKNDMVRLYLLLIYGFNRMLRFNSKGDFNLPVGNVDFNANVIQALKDYCHFVQDIPISFFNLHYAEFLESVQMDDGDFIYLDPPYLISDSEYNKLWSESSEMELYRILNSLNDKGIQWGISNLLCHKRKYNRILEKFANRYETHIIQSNYISFNDNSIKKDSVEVYVTNVKKKRTIQNSLF